MPLEGSQDQSQGRSAAYVMEAFQGLNTSTTRAGVPDEQCYWIDGFMPLDQRNCRTLPGSGSAIYNAVSQASSTVVLFGFFNIGATPYSVIFLANGQVVAVNTNTNVATTVLPPGTITAPSITSVGFSQWGRQYLIIVSDQTNGYWLWDGTLLYKNGTLSPQYSITNAGSGYPGSIATVVFSGGHGTGAAATGSISLGQLVSVSITNPGSGYLPGDTVTGGILPGNSVGSGASITAFVTGATLSSLHIVSGGSGYGPNASLVFTGTGFPQASAFPILTNGTITGTSITSFGAYPFGSAPTVTVTDTAVTASIVFNLMPSGVQGTCVETYQSRVWVGKQATGFFTAPGSFADFATSNGGGNFTSADSFLKVGYSRFLQANGFLYLIADSSCNYISGVQTSGVPITTTFTNQNADPDIGSPYPYSAILQGQNIMFSNSLGTWVLNGSRAVKVSGAMDEVWSTVANFGGLSLSACQASIFNRRVWMTLVRFTDPVSGATGNKCVMWDGGKRWWVSPQDITMTFIAAQKINSVFTAYGTDGTVVSPIFSTPSTAFSKTIQSKLWDNSQAMYAAISATGRFWSVINYKAVNSPGYSVTLDAVANQNGTIASVSQAYSITGPTAAGYFLSSPQAVGNQGMLMGYTFKTNADDMELVSLMTDEETEAYRG